MTARLELERATVRLGGRDVLRELGLAVAAGERVVLAGPSGSGKSTLLRAVAGLVPLHAGDVRIGGRSVAALPPGRREVAMVFQSYALLPHLTVRENLAFGLRARGARAEAAARDVADAADALGLAPLLDRLPRALSGGERQRVALARALLRKPQVFLMDEPLSSLDAPLRAKARAEILRVHARLGAATLYVTHDQAEALAFADRLGILRDGVLEQLGPPLELYRRPRNTFVAGFLGSPPMALLPVGGGELLGVRAEHVRVLGPGRAAAPDGARQVVARLERIEAGGDQSLAWFDAAGAALAARVEPGFAAAPGAGMTLALDPAGACRFDAQTGEALP